MIDHVVNTCMRLNFEQGDDKLVTRNEAMVFAPQICVASGGNQGGVEGVLFDEVLAVDANVGMRS